MTTKRNKYKSFFDKQEETRRTLLNKSNIIREYGYVDRSDFKDRKVVVLEKIRGLPIKVVFDGAKVHVKTGKQKLSEVIDILNKKYMKKFAEIVQTFNMIPFVIFGEYISWDLQKDILYIGYNTGPTIVFYDIYINKNWVCADDLEKLILGNDLPYSSLLHYGDFDEEKIKELANARSKFSSFPNQLIEAVIIKPALEDESYSTKRIITKMTNKAFKTLPPVEKSYVVRLAEEIIKKHTSYERVLMWDQILQDDEIKLTKENKGLVLSSIVKRLINSMYIDIFDTSSKNFVSENTLTKQIKKILPKVIMEKMKLK